MLHDEAKPSLGWQEGIALSPYVTLPKEKKGGDGIIPSFPQIKLISSRALLKEEVLRSGSSVLLITLCYSWVPSCFAAAVKAEDLLPDLQPPRP